MYVTPRQLADGSDALRELAELYGVDPALLRVVIDDDADGTTSDVSAWDPAEVATAEGALDSIKRYAELAHGEVDARLAVRGYALPLDAAQYPVLTVWARAIARYHLNRTRDKTDAERGRIERDYRDALRALDLVAAGKLSLGADDPGVVAGGGAVQVTSDPRMFSRKSLGRL